MSPSPSFPVLTGAPQPPHRYGEVCVLLDPDVAVVWLHGDIDLAVQEELDGAVTDLTEAALPVLVDASKMTFCDSAAVHFLASLLRAGLSVRVQDPTGRLARLLEVVLAPDAVLSRVRTAQEGTRGICIVDSPAHSRSSSAAFAGATPSSGSAATPEVAAFAARVVQLRRARRRAQRMRATRH